MYVQTLYKYVYGVITALTIIHAFVHCEARTGCGTGELQDWIAGSHPDHAFISPVMLQLPSPHQVPTWCESYF